ncbi:MAG TPA: hypothetical protein VM941_00205, partial [Pyrinomonadaceae bacterium]|nr:hypothetical protein [Pyrinomonadaceae bacterium]
DIARNDIALERHCSGTTLLWNDIALERHCSGTTLLWNALFITPTALANFSPGLSQPWVRTTTNRLNAESVG